MAGIEFEDIIPLTELWYSEKQCPGIKFGLKIVKTLFSGQSDFQRLEFFETQEVGRLFVMDGVEMLTEFDEYIYHEMIVHVPVLAHVKKQEPKQVLVIGGGDGGTVRELVKHPSVEKITLVEIDSMVVEKCKEFLPATTCELDNPKVDLRIADGIAWVRDKFDAYDIIIIDSTDPIGPGKGLFTAEFYADTHKALKADGILVCQTETPYYYPKTIRMIYGALGQAYQTVRMYLAAIPTYPSGNWSFAFCPKGQVAFDPNQVQATNLQTKYYNAGIHQAAFVLPTFVQELLQT